MIEEREMISNDVSMRGKLDTLDARYKYLTGGRATFTLATNINRYTYRVIRKETIDGKYIYFVSVLVGPDNWTNYKYAGLLDTVTMTFRPTRNSKIDPTAPSMMAFKWALAHLDSNLFEFWHEGSCCICGRKLTVPESIVNGIGPICLNK